jgi:ribosome-binding ATPase YchF (GTP1/OBG family)
MKLEVGPFAKIPRHLKQPQQFILISRRFTTNLLKGFLSAEVMPFETFQGLGSKALDVYTKKMKKEGKDYVVQDGDIVLFKCKIVK